MRSNIKKKLLRKYHAQSLRLFNRIYIDPKRLKEQWGVYEHDVFKNSFISAPRNMMTEGWNDILLEDKRRKMSNVKNKMLRSKYGY